MSFLHKKNTLTFALLWFMTAFVAVFSSCNYGSEKIVEPPEEPQQVICRNCYIQGSLNYLHSMKIDDVKIVTLDKKCNATDTLIPRFDSTGFKLDTFHLTRPYLKVIARFASDSTLNKKMEFVQYADSSISRHIKLNMLASVSSKALENELCNEHLDYQDARDKAYRKTARFFGYDKSDYDGSDVDAIGRDPYIFSRYFVSDSVFYSDYKNMAAAIANGEFGDTLYRTRAADDLVKYFKMDRWEAVRGMYEKQWVWPNAIGTTEQKTINLNVFPNFWENAYGFPYCTEELLGDTVVNMTRGSAFYDTTFICDQRHGISVTDEYHWRLINKTERELGPCLCTTRDYKERDSLYYSCNNFYWVQVTDPTTIVNLAVKACQEYYKNKLTTYRDTVYMCLREDYKDTVFENVILDRTRYIWTADTNTIKTIYPIAMSCVQELSMPCGDIDHKMICGKFYYCVNEKWEP